MVDHFLSTFPAAEGPVGHAILDERRLVCKLRTVGIPYTLHVYQLVSIVMVHCITVSVVSTLCQCNIKIYLGTIHN